MADFLNIIDRYENYDFTSSFARIDDRAAGFAAGRGDLRAEDFLALLSPAAAAALEDSAQSARRITLQHFGKTIQIYTPMYLSDHCENRCLYCGFSAANKFTRKKLSLAEVEKEAASIAARGFKHILILTGESRHFTPVSYIEDCAAVLKKYFSSISIEIYPLKEEEYAALVKAGVDGLTIYQETYNRGLYDRMHLSGPKKDYVFRLGTPGRGAAAGMMFINIGALLGLDDWRREVFFTGLHAEWLQRHYPQAEISVSLPRLRPNLSAFKGRVTVTDRDIVQAAVALRLFLPRCGITISTRESSQFRDHILPLGVTRMSAESSTAVGGHTASGDLSGQFEICDSRSLEEVKASIRAQGYQPVMKNW